MKVIAIELLDGTKGRDFVLWAPNGLERFSARLLETQTTLHIGWTDNLPYTVLRIREVQKLVGGAGSFTRISGTASDRLEAAIMAGRFRVDKAAELLRRSLGGEWQLSVVLRGAQNDVFDIVAERLGELE